MLWIQGYSHIWSHQHFLQKDWQSTKCINNSIHLSRETASTACAPCIVHKNIYLLHSRPRLMVASVNVNLCKTGCTSQPCTTPPRLHIRTDRPNTSQALHGSHVTHVLCGWRNTTTPGPVVHKQIRCECKSWGKHRDRGDITQGPELYLLHIILFSYSI